MYEDWPTLDCVSSKLVGEYNAEIIRQGKKRRKNNKFYMEIARAKAEQSYARRAKVGAVMVKGDNILAVGYNGTPSGWDNVCEREFSTNGLPTEYITKAEVLHAESNMIAKVARSTQSSDGSTVYTTMSPCMDCAKQMYQAGVVRVVYLEEYSDTTGIEFLKEAGVNVEQLDRQ